MTWTGADPDVEHVWIAGRWRTFPAAKHRWTDEEIEAALEWEESRAEDYAEQQRDALEEADRCRWEEWERTL